MGWRILQAFVALIVLFANVYWQWTPNAALAAAWAGMAAIAVSWLVGKLIDLRRYGWAVLLSGKQRSDSGARSIRPRPTSRPH